jgi:hypothetical protein
MPKHAYVFKNLKFSMWVTPLSQTRGTLELSCVSFDWIFGYTSPILIGSLDIDNAMVSRSE